MRKAFSGLATLLLVVVLAEFFFAASGAFGATPGGESYRPHHALGYVIFLLPVAMAIVAALARMPGRLIWMPLAIAGLVAVQVLIAELAKAFADTGAVGRLIFGLHAVNGLAILATAGMIVRQARALSRPRPSLTPNAESLR
jgi:hypothetical protein